MNFFEGLALIMIYLTWTSVHKFEWWVIGIVIFLGLMVRQPYTERRVKKE